MIYQPDWSKLDKNFELILYINKYILHMKRIQSIKNFKRP